MRRRQFLASSGALLSVAVAGCGHPLVVLDMDDATDDRIASEVSTTAEPGSEEHSLVTAALDNGSATRTGRHELFDRTDVVEVDDTFYEVSETRLRSSEQTVYEVLVHFDTDDPTPELGAIEYDDLPDVDRRRLEPVFSEGTPSDRDEYVAAVEYGPIGEVGNSSLFVPERQYDAVVHGGNRYRVTVNSRDAPEAEYRYEVTEVATDVGAFADRMRDRYLFALAGLSDAERAVVEQAVDGGHFDDNDAFRSVVDRIRDHEGLNVADSYGTWLVAYEDGEYLAYAEW